MNIRQIQAKRDSRPADKGRVARLMRQSYLVSRKATLWQIEQKAAEIRKELGE